LEKEDIMTMKTIYILNEFPKIEERYYHLNFPSNLKIGILGLH